MSGFFFYFLYVLNGILMKIGPKGNQEGLPGERVACFLVPYENLGPVYTEKSCPGQEGHPPTRVNFTERLYEKKVDPSARAKS